MFSAKIQKVLKSTELLHQNSFKIIMLSHRNQLYRIQEIECSKQHFQNPIAKFPNIRKV